MDRRQELHARKNRLLKLSSLPVNKVCSECPERKPTWASLLQPPVANGQRMGVLCCYKCYSFHFQLGKDVCSVKNMKMVEEWTDEEIEALERGGGNQLVNAIYEALLKPSHCKYDYDKSALLPEQDEDAALRRRFVRAKYQELKYFDVDLYHQHLAGSIRSTPTTSETAALAQEGPVSFKDSARRCKSFDDKHRHFGSVEDDRSKDFVRKPIRRRSQSFKEEIWAPDDDMESTDDDQAVAYQMPGHLGVAGGARQQQQRRQSMPLQTGGSHGSATNKANLKPSPKVRRQRRASIRESLHKEAQERRASQTGTMPAPSNNDLGYGDDGANEESDATCRRSNRRRRDSISAGRRRMSMPVGKAVQDCMSGCPSTAPKMPTRCVSDESTAEESEFDADDNFTDAEEPAKDCQGPPPPSRRLRRMSMPHVVPSSDTEDEEFSGRSPPTRLSDPFIGHRPSPYGMDLGYGYNGAEDSHNAKQPPGRNVTPRRMSRRGSSAGSSASMPRRGSSSRMPRRGSSTGTQCVEAVGGKSRSNAKLLGDPAVGDSGFSSEELELASPVDVARKEKRRSKKHSSNTTKDKGNRRTLRRCSTGGALDKFRTDPQPRPAAPEHGESRGNGLGSNETEIDLGYEEHMQNWVPPESSNVHTASKLARPMRRGSMGGVTGAFSRSKEHQQASIAATDPRKNTPRSSSKGKIRAAKPPVSTEDLGYGDLGYGHDARTIPSEEDLGYGTLDEDETSSREELGYEDLGYGEHYGNDSLMDERTPAMPADRRMSRRGSSTGIHHRPGRRLSSTQGSGESTSRSSSRARRPSAGGPLSMPHCHRRPSLRQERRSSNGSGANSLLTNPPNMLANSRAALMRSDSVSSMCSEVSVNAALLYAGDKKVSNNQCTDSDGVVSIRVVSRLDQCECEDPGLDVDDDVSFSSEAAEPSLKRQSKKDYWKAKLAEKSKTETRKDVDILSSSERRARRRLSVGPAA